MIYNYSNKKILILGMGKTGLSCINFFLSKGIFPKIMDTNKNPKCITEIHKFKNIRYHIGSINYSWILESNLIISSPGISYFHPALTFAYKHNIEIIGDIELFTRETKVPIIAITGSNGKSSVAAMVKEIIEKAGFSVYLGGNIGIPALSIINKSADFFVLELSSFQLEQTFSLKAYVSTVLNITPDHINRYPLGIKQYARIKQKIYKNAKICVINLDDKLSFKKLKKHVRYISFGENQGDYHLNSINKNIWLYYQSHKLINTTELKISGKHNYINMLSALSIVHALKIRLDVSLPILKNFLGLPHRYQIICQHNDILWINDSKSTNIMSTAAAINNISKTKKIRLILGGDSKFANLSPLKSILKNKLITIYCYGKDKKKFFKLYPYRSMCFNTLSEVIRCISRQVQSGDIVLLSPACSSLDQFPGFEARGDAFSKLVKELIF